jgi:hypothetical protein
LRVNHVPALLGCEGMRTEVRNTSLSGKAAAFRSEFWLADRRAFGPDGGIFGAGAISVC